MKNIILMLLLVVATSTQAQNTIGSYIGNKKEIKIKDKIFVTESYDIGFGIYYKIYNSKGLKDYESLQKPKYDPNIDYDFEYDRTQMRELRDQVIKEVFSFERLRTLGEKKHYIAYFLDQNGKTLHLKLFVPNDSKITPDEIYQLDQKLKRVRFKFIRDTGWFVIMMDPIRFSKIN